MANTAKANKLAREFGDKLQKRLAALAFTLASDSDNNPYWSIGPGTAGSKSAIVKVLPTSWTLAKDLLGNTANLFANHTVQLCTEANITSGAGADVLDIPTLLPLLYEVLSLGARVEWYQTANGVAPTVGALVAGNLKGSIDQLYWPLISSQ